VFGTTAAQPDRVDKPGETREDAHVFGLDDRIAALSDGGSVWIVLAIAILLGLRHATDPDHIAAVTALVAGGRERAGRAAARLGLFWGLGHATTLFAFGLPIILLSEYLPERVQQAAETAIALVIVTLAARLLYRWRRDRLHVHEHDHGGVAHAHVHGHAGGEGHAHPHRGRSPIGAFAIGLVHGMGGSAGVGVLILASVGSTSVAVVSLLLLAFFTAVSMTMLSTGFGLTLASRPVQASFSGIAPVLGLASLAFGVWYGLGALNIAPYYF
jgi:ABC-type nickel/cobalt efflux system permease component RcnA